jgi:hypothetical protein
MKESSYKKAPYQARIRSGLDAVKFSRRILAKALKNPENKGTSRQGPP